MPGVDFSRRANGDDLKCGSGGCLKGPAILPSESSCSIFCLTTAGFSLTDRELLESRWICIPLKSSLNPSVKPVTMSCLL